MKQWFGIVVLAATPVLAQVTINNTPSREFGHAKLSNPPASFAPNLVEGKELNSPSGIAFDFSVSPPIVYIADAGNNRVLAWKNATSLAKGNPADKVIGQHDFYSTFGQGPGTTLSTGLAAPVAVAVDSSGNLYVADGGNNRILRYPAPFKQTGDLLQVDLVIGQTNVSSGNRANEGQSAPSAKTIYLSSGGGYLRAGMAFDAQGNLWFTDAGNNRVLRYPAANLTPNTSEPAADLVLGQFDFVSNSPPSGANVKQTNMSALLQPTSLAFDQAGRLYVADDLARVLQYGSSLTSGAAASRVLGVEPTPQQGAPPPYPTGSTLGLIASGAFQGAPDGVFTMGNYLFVCDTPENRVVRYDVPENWPPATASAPSPPEAAVIGQLDFNSGQVNQGRIQPNAASFAAPVGGAVNPSNGEVWIVDGGNNRVLAFAPAGNLMYTMASRVLGQLDYSYGTPNLIEGKEVWLYANTSSGAIVGGGIAVDKHSDPPHLYIADTLNNRILCFRDARSVGTDARSLLTQKADLVIGQPDLFSALPNYSPNNQTPSDEQVPNDTGLLRPIGLAVDANGNLYVADSGNGRVLRFPSPFAQPAGLPHANLVLGQGGFSTEIKDPSSSTMNTPFGLVIFSEGSLAVSDAAHNRILIFRKPAGDFTSGQAADIVLGQQDFFSTQAGNSTSSLNNPRHLAADTDDRLYVCDNGNNRLLVFNNAHEAVSGASAAAFVNNLYQIEGVAVSAATGESWVTTSNTLYRFPVFPILQLTQQATASIGIVSGPLALALDQYDNLIVAEAANRIAFYFPRMYYRHAASYESTQPMAPGMLAVLGRYGQDFSLTPASVQPLPWPATLNDVDVLVNGVAAPVFELSQTAIYFQVPMTTPSSGAADFFVVQHSTGLILAAATFQMQQATPGLFTANQAGTGQAAATNDVDGSVNGASNPVARGAYITLWLTGQGKVDNPPPDGVAPGAALSTPVPPAVIINGVTANIQYSGLSPQYPGLWQINAQVPMNTPPGNNISVLVTLYDHQSNIGPNPSNQSQDTIYTVANGLITTIAVK